jgi:hypothetical protein
MGLKISRLVRVERQSAGYHGGFQAQVSGGDGKHSIPDHEHTLPLSSFNGGSSPTRISYWKRDFPEVFFDKMMLRGKQTDAFS